jgi:type II secretory ATPase GspE/PulE/Tfp pilus assembly ATPase PilB-like protein
MKRFSSKPDPATDREASAPEILEALAHRAEQAGASDVHLHMVDGRLHVAFRLDGAMTPVTELPDRLALRVLGRVKFLAKLKTYQDAVPQDGRIEKGDLGLNRDVRVATYPTVTGEKVVLRLFGRADVRTLDRLGLPDGAREELLHVFRGGTGLLLLTGPAGSGKTTTIYACLRHLAEGGGRHIITVEDPVEQVVPGVMQTEVNAAAGLDFARAARHLMRQDPEVLVIGEIRDDETANIAVRAAFTGHLVISTLHAGSCRGVFERLFVMCEDRYAATAAVEMVLNQRLVRRHCESCGGAGCDDCLGSGYRGRMPVAEWVRIDNALRARIRDEGPAAVRPETPLRDAAQELTEQGRTTEAEVSRVLGTES